jgi:outer membrane protein OmpA-like peptidoglycan-associated protein
MMKRLTMIAASLLLLGGVASAQQSKSDETLEFRPHWSLGVQGGAAHTRGEQRFGDLISPSAQVSATYNFHHAMGVRLGLGGWQGKGGALTTSGYEGYAFNYGQFSADYVLDLANLFGGFKHDRVVNPYVFAGVGAAYGFGNDEAAAYKDILEYYWEGGKFFVPGRAGLGVDFRLGDKVTLGLEGNTFVLSDKFNSKRADNPDWQFNVLAGLKFALGGNTRPSKAYAEKVAAEEAAAAAAAAAAAEAERLAAEKAAREAAERAAAEKAAAEKAAREAAERAAAERAAKAAENSDNVFFTIGSTYIRKAEGAKLEKLAEWMKANPDFNVSLVGYADKETGTAKGNERLSANRAKVVKERLEKLGIDGSRIMTAYKGDTVQPFAENAKNRVVICTLE